MDELTELKTQLVALMCLSDEIEETQPHARRQALENMQSVIQGARARIICYALDIIEPEGNA